MCSSSVEVGGCHAKAHEKSVDGKCHGCGVDRRRYPRCFRWSGPPSPRGRLSRPARGHLVEHRLEADAGEGSARDRGRPPEGQPPRLADDRPWSDPSIPRPLSGSSRFLEPAYVVSYRHLTHYILWFSGVERTR